MTQAAGERGRHRTRRRLARQEIELLADLAENSSAVAEIAETLNVPAQTVRYWLHKLGFWPRHDRRFSEVDLERFRRRLASEEFRARNRLLKADSHHTNAGLYVVTAPDGAAMSVSNLAAWCEQNAHLFGGVKWRTVYQHFTRGRRYKAWRVEKVEGGADDLQPVRLDWTTDPRPLWECVEEWRKGHGWTWVTTARKLGQNVETVKKWRHAHIQPRNTLPTRIIMTLIDAAR